MELNERILYTKSIHTINWILQRKVCSHFFSSFHLSIYSIHLCPMNWSFFVDSNIAKLWAWLKWNYMYKWWLYVINFFLIGFDLFTSVFFSFWCAREWPNFTCIEFYLLKDIKRISIFTVAVVLAFFGFHSCVFVCLSVCLFCICFENNEKRVKQKNDFSFLFTFVPARIVRLYVRS